MFFSKKYCIRDENMVCFYRKRDFRLSKKGTAMKFSIRTIAKNLYEAVRSASLYTVIISVFLLVFIAETGFDSAAIVFRDYVTIFLVSLLIAFANFLFKSFTKARVKVVFPLPDLPINAIVELIKYPFCSR